MIVKYVRERRNDGEGKDPWVTFGKNYLVLGIIMKKKLSSSGEEKNICAYIQGDDDNGPAVFDL